MNVPSLHPSTLPLPLPLPIRILLVDDHPLVREGLSARIDGVDDLLVVGEAGDAETALREAHDQLPHVVLMDIGMPGTNGIDLTVQMLDANPELVVIMLSMYDSASYAQRAMAAGARGYVLKDSPSAEILSAIRTVYGGGTYLSPVIAQRLFRAPVAGPVLSDREQQILSFLGKGLASKQIARELDLSVRTVESHRQSIRRKLNLAGQAELIKYAVEHGVVGRG